MAYSWICPYCKRATTITSSNRVSGSTNLVGYDNVEGNKRLVWWFIVCPNPDCNKFTLSLYLYDHKNLRKAEETWNLIPPSKAKGFPSYIPQGIIDDYNEACLICNLSPKASATLSRRCLQGIIRDFGGVKPGKLFNEIDQIKDKVDPTTWEAIDSVRKMGNIGAHMEKDINVIVDVEPDEAELLIWLIETLIKDWHIAGEERKKRLGEIKAVAEQEDSDKKKKSS